MCYHTLSIPIKLTKTGKEVDPRPHVQVSWSVIAVIPVKSRVTLEILLQTVQVCEHFPEVVINSAA